MTVEEYDEFIYKRCEDILKDDEIYNKLNNEILQLERQLKRNMGSNKRQIYNQLEEKIITSIIHSQVCIYKNCLVHEICFNKNSTPLTPP